MFRQGQVTRPFATTRGRSRTQPPVTGASTSRLVSRPVRLTRAIIEDAMAKAAWNHNIHYHDVVLRSVPSNCRQALEVGCGQGLLARQLARQCEQIVAIDVDHDALACARATSASEARIEFVEGDVMTYSFSDGSFDLVTAVATLHHLPLKPALERFRSLLRSGGVLALVGLYRPNAFGDYAFGCGRFSGELDLGLLTPTCGDRGTSARPERDAGRHPHSQRYFAAGSCPPATPLVQVLPHLAQALSDCNGRSDTPCDP